MLHALLACCLGAFSILAYLKLPRGYGIIAFIILNWLMCIVLRRVWNGTK